MYNKKIIALLIIVLASVMALNAQDRSNFQKYYSDVQQVLGKQVENLSSGDLNVLKDAIKLDPMTFGAQNQKLVNKMVQDAREKKSAYDNYIHGKQKLQKTEEDLQQTTSEKQVAIARGDSLQTENLQLKDIIDQLNKRINKLEKEQKSLQSVNRKLRDEQIKTKDLLETSRGSIKRILAMIPVSPKTGDFAGQLPSTLQDSLTQSECQVADLLKNNFLLTLDGMKRDQPFIDSASIYFKENGRHLAQLDEFFMTGNDLISRLRSWGSNCAQGFATDIENSMGEFKLSIENKEQSSAFISFLKNSLPILIPSVLIIAVLVILLLRKNKANK